MTGGLANLRARPVSVPAALRPGGWPEASLPEHVALGKFERGVSLLVWGYNEEVLVEWFLKKAVDLLSEVAVDWEIVFVDDCSTDRTAELLHAFAAREPRLKIIRHERNLNVGMACRTAIAHASKEFFFSQTVDWAYDIGKLRIFLELLKYFDVVQGVRPVPIRLLSYIPIIRSIYRVRSRSDSLYKAIISITNYYVLRILFGAAFHDFQNLTFYRTETIRKLEIFGRTSFVNPELLLKSYYSGASFIEVPIRFIPRTAGAPKGTRLTAVVRAVFDTAKNWIAWGALYRFRYRDPRKTGHIARIAEPFRLGQPVLRLSLPLLDDFS
jgi:glycosyltransferase involved in cell wall biosynthesis